MIKLQDGPFHLSQIKYLSNLLHWVKMHEAKPISMPMLMSESGPRKAALYSIMFPLITRACAFQYAMITHLDIAISVNKVF